MLLELLRFQIIIHQTVGPILNITRQALIIETMDSEDTSQFYADISIRRT